MYRARSERAKGQRLDASMRSISKGGKRVAAAARAAAGKRLQGSASRNKLQQRAMCLQAETRALRYASINWLARGPQSLAKLLREERLEHDEEKARVARVKVQSMRATWRVTPTGRARQQALTALGCIQLLPAKQPGVARKKGRGNQLKDAAVAKATSKKLMEHRKAAALEKTRLSRKRPMSERERRMASAKPDGVTRGGHVAKRQRQQPARAAAVAALSSLEEVESESESESECEGEEEMLWDQLVAEEEYVADAHFSTAASIGAQQEPVAVGAVELEARRVEAAPLPAESSSSASSAQPALPAAAPAPAPAPAMPPARLSPKAAELAALRERCMDFESRFQLANKRKPSKADINQQPHIKRTYKLYYELKAALAGRVQQ